MENLKAESVMKRGIGTRTENNVFTSGNTVLSSLSSLAVQEKMLLMAREEVSFKYLGQKQNLAAAGEGKRWGVRRG